MIRIKKTMMINVPSWQIKLRIPVHSWSGRQIVKTGHWENENCQFLLKNLVLHKNDVAIDVGANIGWYSLLLDKIASSGDVLAFEMHPGTFALLLENLKLNNAKRVTAVQAGLSNKAGSEKMYLNKEDVGSHSMLPLANQRRTAPAETITLNAYLKKASIRPSRVKFVKLDIEGAELLALQGATDILQTCPLIMLEYAPLLMRQGNVRPQELLDMMAGYGYRAHYLIRGELHAAHPASLQNESAVELFWRK